MITLKEQLMVLSENFVELHTLYQKITQGYIGRRYSPIPEQFKDYLNKNVISVDIEQNLDGGIYYVIIIEE